MSTMKMGDVVADEDHLSCSISPTAKVHLSPRMVLTLKLSLPFMLCAVYLLFLKCICIPDGFYQHAALIFLSFIPLAGEETIIPLGTVSGFLWYLMAISMMVLGISCMFIVWNLNLICRVSVFGGWVATRVRAGKTFLDRFPWLSNISVLGLVLFVLAPFQGRGGIGNSVLGKIIGMSSWNIMVAVGVGSFLASVLFSFGFHSIEHYLKIDSTLLFGGVVIIAIFVVICRHFSQEEKEIKNSYTNGT